MSNFWDNKRVTITGGSGFLGSYVVEALRRHGARDELISIPRRASDDLRQWEHCQRVAAGQDVIIHLAATVGGIGINREKPGEFFYDNLMMGVQLIEAARRRSRSGATARPPASSCMSRMPPKASRWPPSATAAASR